MAAACGGSFCGRQRRQQREADQASGLTEPSVATHSAASVSPRRIASTPSWIAVAPDAQAVDSEIGEPLVPKRLGQMRRRPSRTGSAGDRRETAAAADAQQVVVVDLSLAPSARPSSSRCGHSTSTGATARNSGPGKSPLRADAGLRDRLLGGDFGEPLGEARSTRTARPATKSTVPAIVVFKPVGREAGDGADAGFAGGQFRPVVGLAGAERGDDAHAGDDDDRPCRICRVVLSCFPVASSAVNSLDRFDQRHAFAAPVTGPDHHNLGRRLGISTSTPDRIVRRKQRAARRSTRPPARAPAEIASPWCGRTCVPVARTGKSGCLAEERAFLAR